MSLTEKRKKKRRKKKKRKAKAVILKDSQMDLSFVGITSCVTPKGQYFYFLFSKERSLQVECISDDYKLDGEGQKIGAS